MATDKIKILVSGDVEGKFDTLFKRVEAISKNAGPFDVLFCVGNFFGINNKQLDPYKIGDKKVPIQTYILGPNAKDLVNCYPEDESEYEICPNLYYLGKRGLFNDNKGLKIAYLSGVYDKEHFESYTYSEKDVTDLCEICLKGNPSFRGVDILLTSQWPTGIIDNNKISLTKNSTSHAISYLCTKLKPRYIFSGFEGLFYERPPFRSPATLNSNDTTMETVTRFIGLARVGNPMKNKWIYGMTITPIDKMKISELMQRTTDETVCPFDSGALEDSLFGTKGKRKQSEPNQYFYDMTSNNATGDKKSKKHKIEFDQSKCWFCLASPSVEKHLVVTVGTSCYMALAKGGLVDEHFLICPIEHHQSCLSLPDEAQKELKSFKDAVKELYNIKYGRVPVFFERNYKTSHMQLQAIPIPKKATKELQQIFEDESESQGFKLSTLEAHNRLEQVLQPRSPYFTVELPDGVILYTKIQSEFPLNFAREVLASGPILNMEDRVEWRECVLGRNKEESLVTRIRREFEQFDFTND